MTNKELDLKACEVFVCPNFNEMDNVCKQLGLDEETIKRCRDIGIEYLKKTYHMPAYASINYVIPAFIYIGANMYYEDRVRYIVCGNIKKKIGMAEIVTLYDVSVATGSKWLNNVISILGIKKSNLINKDRRILK